VSTSDSCIVWMANKQWDDFSVDRSLAAELSRHTPILWVDAPLSAATSARRRYGAKRRLGPVLSELPGGIARLTPAALPGLTRPGVRLTTAPLVRAQVGWALRRTGRPARMVVATTFGGVLGWRGTPAVLYATDDYVAGAGLMRAPEGWLRRQERRALSRASLVTAQSWLLAEQWTAAYGRPVAFVPNGCTPGRTAVPALPGPARAAVGSLPRPVLVLAGRLNARLDLALLEAVADAGYSLLLVGGHDPRWEPRRFAALTARPAVHHAGRVAPEEVAGYLAAADAGLTPYTGSRFNQASFPVKTLDYLSAGRPVVSTGLPAARWLAADLARSGQAAMADLILAVADDQPGFLAAVRRLVGGPGSAPAGPAAEPALAPQCRAFAARHSWARRADILAGLLGLTPARGPAHPPAGGPGYAPAESAAPARP
jgi:teichuronic acid biosynthesis glycosyltransferase TuaH